jgi:hypothetical protein
MQWGWLFGLLAVAPPLALVVLVVFALETWYENTPTWYSVLMHVILFGTPVVQVGLAYFSCRLELPVGRRWVGFVIGLSILITSIVLLVLFVCAAPAFL